MPNTNSPVKGLPVVRPAELRPLAGLRNFQAPAPTTARAMKAAGQLVTSSSTLARTWGAKYAIPWDADAVALVLPHHDVSNALTGVRASLAVTELPCGDVSADRLHPVVAGTPYKVHDDTASPFGWRSLTFAGAANPVLAQPTDTYVPSNAVSDFVALPPCPASGGPAGVRYVLFRVFIPGIAGNEFAFLPFTNANTPTAENGGFTCEFGFATGDIVTTTVTNSTSFSATGGIPMGLIYRSRSRGFCYVAVGDSITQSNASGLTAEPMAPWPLRAAQKASNFPGEFSAVNLGCSSGTQAQFLAAAQSGFPVYKPTVSSFTVGSPNDGPWATLAAARLYFAAAKARTYEFLALCDANRCAPILMTMLPCSTAVIPSTAAGALIEDERVAHNAWAREVFRAGDAVLMDADAAISDGGTIDSFGICRLRVELRSDETHPNETGTALLSTLAQTALRSAVA